MRRWLLVLLGLSVAGTALAAGVDPVTPVLLGLFVVFLSAKLGGYLAVKCRQPAVLGELLVGMILGNLVLLGFDGLEFVKKDIVFEVLAGIGVVLLLFEVGLESSISELLKVGMSSLLVAVAGIVAPLALGYYVGVWFLPQASDYAHAFLGATLCATSVGITARVLKDLGKLHSQEAKVILGAAVIDDVLGLIILAVVQGLVISASIAGGESAPIELSVVALICVKALGFLLISVLAGLWLGPHIFRLGAKIRLEGMMATTLICTCFIFAYFAGLAGLAPIVGAFAAGLIIDASGFDKYFPHEEKSIEDYLVPVSKFFVPIFFVTMGMKVNLAAFLNPQVLLLAAAITVAAIAGKQVCSFAAIGKGLNRTAIGIGMIPRGEVGLIFASIGAQLFVNGERVIDDTLYAAIVVMVAVTTVVTPPALKWSLARKA